ncbi:DUF262 domain-containing protein [Vibrio genomosp. F6]|uniref:GmrSD restriction endonucleases N-terminal domain-containing protein n=1 Tax=Vibrio genomosp. F6 str. FF-238 TaxID=1191298 RepID=A0A1E5D6E5_9VIBR|nr:DUF262 domain-containing protein [Vibrio genomosp. F6]OEE79206.1 hypothetical protein A130_11785 [Vibrio genomosp. F6 str. FF-238]
MNNSKNEELQIKEELSESGEKIGIEAEEDSEQIEPFDPEAISIAQKIVPMDTLIRRLRQGSILLSPSFQRNEVWNNTRKSLLIESIMLRIPLPMFYVAEDEQGNWEVVDGLQRLSAIRDFMMGDKNGMPLQLKNLEFLGKRYGDQTWKLIEEDNSSQKLVNSIYETEMRFTVIEPGTPEAVKRNIFKRINTGGMPLTAQEIRHALYEGPASKLLNELVNSNYFIRAIGKKIDDSRMGATELVLRLLSFMVFPREDYKHGMDSWLSNAMRVINLMPDPSPTDLEKIFSSNSYPQIKMNLIAEIRTKFELAMKRSTILFDGHAFRKSNAWDSRKSPINKSLFEVWGNVLCELKEDEFQILVNNKHKLQEEQAELFTNDNFSNSISRHSSQIKGITDSYSSIQQLVYTIIFTG